jgi:hypothetical protein
MCKMCTKSFGLLLVLICVVAAFPARASSLLGDTIQVNYLFPNSGTIFTNFPTAVVTAGGAPFDIFGHDTFTVLPTEVTMTNDDQLDHLFVAAAFNGFSVNDVTAPGRITGVTIDPLTNLAGFTQSDIVLQGTTLLVNFQSLTSLPTTYVQLDLTTTSTVPEPASITVLTAGLAGIAFLLRRKKLA